MDVFAFLFQFEQQFEIPEEEAEWVGLNLEEAVEKQRQLEHKVKHTHACPTFYLRISNLYIFLMLRCLFSLQELEPLFKVYVDKLVEELRIQNLSEPHVIEKK